MDNIFLQVSALLGITVSIAFLVRLLRQPLLVAYIIAGIVAGPLVLNFMHGDASLYQAFSEFGIVLLLFVVGLSLNIHHIQKIGKVAFITGFAQFLCTTVVGTGVLTLLHFPLPTALYLGAAISFSSTIVIVKILNDKKHTQSVYGRYITGLMVVQDLFAIVLLLILTTFKQQGASISSVLSILVIKLLVLFCFVYIISKYALPKILDHVARSAEFLFIFTVAWCFGVASILHWLGFSVEIGAIIAGISLGSSPYQAEISSRIRPLRDFFLVIFFVILGSQMHLSALGTVIIPALLLSLYVLFGNPLILYQIFRWQKFTRRNSFLASVSAGQVSEFGFVLLFTGIQLGHLGGNEISIFTLIALLTIFFSSYFMTYNEELYTFLSPILQLFGKETRIQKEEKQDVFDVIVLGYHRIGWKVCEMLSEKKISFAVVDFDPARIAYLHRKGIPAFFGDAADVEFLATLPFEHARLVISTLPEAQDQETMIKHIRSRTKKPAIIANLLHNGYLEDLYEAGASYVMMPHLLGGVWMAEMLVNDPWTKQTFDHLRQEQKQEMMQRVGTAHA